MSSESEYRQFLEGLIERIAGRRSTVRDAKAVRELAALAEAAGDALADQVGPEGAVALLRARGIDVQLRRVDEISVH